MNSTTTTLALVLLVGLLAMGFSASALAGEDGTSGAAANAPGQNQDDRLAAKAMSDDELARVSAGLFFTQVNVRSRIIVVSSNFFRDIGVDLGVLVKTEPQLNFIKVGHKFKVGHK